MAALRKLSTTTLAMMGKLRKVMGAVTGIALSYGVYKTLLGNQLSQTMRTRSEAANAITVSPNIQKPPFDVENPPSGHSSGKAGDDGEAASIPDCGPGPQPSVASHDRAYSLFLRLLVKDGFDIAQVASSVASLQDYVQQVEGFSCPSQQRIVAGVGFGPQFYQRLMGGEPQPFTNARHELLSASTPGQTSVGGDILIHAKSNWKWMLEQLSQLVQDSLPKGCVLSMDETIGQHKDAEVVARRQSSKDHLGIINYHYIQGQLKQLPTRDPHSPSQSSLMFVQESGKEDTEAKRREAAVDPRTHGSYVLTQRWVHDVRMVDSAGKVVMNDWVDKAWEMCATPLGENKFKPLNALGADLAYLNTGRWMDEAYRDCIAVQKRCPRDSRIYCVPGKNTPLSAAPIVRQSVPYRKSGGEFGLFFISYCHTPRQHELLVDRLIASTCCEDKLNTRCAEVFKMSHNVHSGCWYFPSLAQLCALRRTEDNQPQDVNAVCAINPRNNAMCAIHPQNSASENKPQHHTPTQSCELKPPPIPSNATCAINLHNSMSENQPQQNTHTDNYRCERKPPPIPSNATCAINLQNSMSENQPQQNTHTHAEPLSCTTCAINPQKSISENQPQQNTHTDNCRCERKPPPIPSNATCAINLQNSMSENRPQQNTHTQAKPPSSTMCAIYPQKSEIENKPQNNTVGENNPHGCRCENQNTARENSTMQCACEDIPQNRFACVCDVKPSEQHK